MALFAPHVATIAKREEHRMPILLWLLGVPLSLVVVLWLVGVVLAVGVLGGFTTFSSYAYESMAYVEQGQWGLMLTNVIANNLLCLIAALAGMSLAKVL
jgi:CrcB protein